MRLTCCSISLPNICLFEHFVMVVVVIQYISYCRGNLSNNNSTININVDIPDSSIVEQSSIPPSIPLEVTVEKLNSTAVRISCPEMDSDRLNNWDVSKSILNINYNLVYAEIFTVKSSQQCLTAVNFSHDHLDQDYYLGQCKQSVLGFSLTDGEEYEHENFTNYCDSHSQQLPLTGNSSVSLVIADLLPGQPYLFTTTLHAPQKNILLNHLNSSDVISGPILDSICMPDDVPRFVPQTDQGSFVILNSATDKKQLQELDIELYWRPVPKMLDSGQNLNYQLSCIDESKNLVFNRSFQDPWQGRTNLTKPGAISYTCELRSNNSVGLSTKFSRIILPRLQDLMNFPRQEYPKFYVAALSNSEYVFKWSVHHNQEGEISSNHKGNESLKDFQYTVYWCVSSTALSGCNYIEGMFRTIENIYYLKMPSIVPQHRTFGLSYRSSRFYSGIIWCDCIATLRSQEQASKEPLKIVEAIGVEGNHTALQISWVFQGCNSMTALVTSFEITLCDLGQVHPCFIPAVGTIANNDLPEFSSVNSTPCSFFKVSNLLTNDAVLKNLNPSTKYSVSIRYSLQNLTSNPWSERVIAYTYADPIDSRNCWQQSILFHVGIFLGTAFTISIIYCTFHRYVRHYLDVIYRYRQSHKELPERLKCKVLDENIFDEAASRFSANKCVVPLPKLMANSNPSLNAEEIEHLSTRSVRKNNQNGNYARHQASILDYIPCQLLIDDRIDQTVTDSNQGSPNDDLQCVLTAADEISLTSQSSFLETILDHVEEPQNE